MSNAAQAAKAAREETLVYVALKEKARAVAAKRYALAYRFDPHWGDRFVEGLADKDAVLAVGEGDKIEAVIAALAFLYEHCQSLTLEIWPGAILEDADWEDERGRRVPNPLRVEIDDSNVEKFSNAESVFDLVLAASDLQAKELPPLVCIVEDVIPEGLTLFGSKPKWGKSWNALDLGHSVATGSTYLGKPCRKGDVLYLALEDSERRMQDRMRKMVGDDPWPPNMLIITIDKKFPRLDEGGLDLIKEWVAGVANPTLILIDTLKKVRPIEDKNRRAYDCDYEALESLHEYVASVPGLGVVVYHHARKAVTADDVFDDFSGTLGLTAVPDHLLAGGRTAGNPKQKELHARGRDLPEFEFAVKFDDETKFRAVVLGNISEAARNANEVAIEELLRDNGTMHFREIASALEARGIKLKLDNVKQICHRMYKANKIASEGKGTGRYSLSGEGDKPWPLVAISELTVNGHWQRVTVTGTWAFVEEIKESAAGEDYMMAALQGDGHAIDVLFKGEALRLVHGVERGREATLRGLLGPNDRKGKTVLAKGIEGVEPSADRPLTPDDAGERAF